MEREKTPPASGVEMSLRAQEWKMFSDIVTGHIESYTVPQYGDKGSDNVTEWRRADCMTQIKKYVNRFGRNQRPHQDKLDLLKIAHYAGMAFFKE